ncbi:hypothetical protein CP863_06445 [Cutibacterium acnes]|jgi:hypothetical protein|uniref:Uncharacterized protein n=1 Tax=Cutibacterium acnes TaxID=1747 RepID=A0AAD0QR78_CUTAC|nr:hypothetical protein DXN06_03250 [Cutibacterium acnes]EFT77546.1 hypothetical protein HMPREF9601_02033 [Cutibacterium acnes HL030PA1]EGL44721.1 hypothetical protein HMPREF9948_1499 [Propionibacterium sp. 434-HC2]PGF31166.1 hypothetical protein B1B10_12790 [Cutibacterium acnes subsp. acnes]QAZ50825.1 hypothetical protein cbac_04735 [Cutibacterium acnes KPA171202]
MVSRPEKGHIHIAIRQEFHQFPTTGAQLKKLIATSSQNQKKKDVSRRSQKNPPIGNRAQVSVH